MKKLIKSTIAVVSAVAMTFTMVATPTVSALADDTATEPELFDTSTMADGEVHYTVAGGFGDVTWTPLAKATEMKAVDGKEDIYSLTAYLPAYDEAAEWNNRFKICKIDNTVLTEGWDSSLCVGTTTYSDNQSQIRILNKKAGMYTIYLDASTGAVAVLDENSAPVELSISWVGYDNETQFMSEAEVTASTLETWPADKVKVEAVPDVATINGELLNDVEKFDTTTFSADEVHYTVAGGFGDVTWTPLAKATEMKAVEGKDGLYCFTAELPAYDEAAEWNNRFKICKIDSTVVTDGWDSSLCLGTTTFSDNQSQIRILNETAGTYTIYFDSTTGGVAVVDENDAKVELSVSWVGYDNETQFMTEAEVTASTLETWPEDKVKVEAVPDVTTIDGAVYDRAIKLDTSTMKDGEVHYTVAGGFGAVQWTPLAGKAEMTKVAGSDNLYVFTAELPAYDEAAEWNNRFKICKIDNTVLTDGWDSSLCLGTTTFSDNQSQIRILNETAGTYYIIFDASTGAVVVKDASNNFVDLSISWVGYDNETQFMTEAEVAASTLDTWPEDKVKVDSVPDVVTINATLKDSLTYDTSTMKEGEVYYTIAGGFGTTTWTPLAKTTTMSETAINGVYSFTAELPAYDEAAEWNNRFKICKIDNTVLTDGWDSTLCVGTTTFADNQSQIRILNETAGTYTIYFDSTTGAVVVQDKDGNNVELSISWVGYDNETQFMSEAEVAASTLDTWPEDKVKVEAVPNLTDISAALTKKLVVSTKGSDEPTPVEPTLSIKAGKKTLYTGKSTNSTTVKATVTGESDKVTFKSSNKKVATVSSKGVVKAKKAGKTVIIVKANGITKKVAITVKNPKITVKKGTKAISSLSLKKGKKASLVVTTSPKKAGIKVAYANSTSKKVIKLSAKTTSTKSKVTVKGLKKGTAKIKITSGGKTKTVKVTVK